MIQELNPVSEEFRNAIENADHRYHRLAHALLGAFEQSAIGKGKERHAVNGEAFDKQQMQSISNSLGTSKGMAFQVSKKSAESCDMPSGPAVQELYGTIVYAAGMVIFREDNG